MWSDRISFFGQVIWTLGQFYIFCWSSEFNHENAVVIWDFSWFDLLVSLRTIAICIRIYFLNAVHFNSRGINLFRFSYGISSGFYCSWLYILNLSIEAIFLLMRVRANSYSLSFRNLQFVLECWACLSNLHVILWLLDGLLSLIPFQLLVVSCVLIYIIVS